MLDVYADSQGPVIENLARRCGGFLKKLSLDECKEIQDGALHQFASRCHNIEELNLHNCRYVTDAYVAYYPRSVAQDTFNAVCSTCSSLGSYCHKLRVLNLDGCVRRNENNAIVSCVSSAGIRAIAAGCANLEEVLLCRACNVPLAHAHSHATDSHVMVRARHR